VIECWQRYADGTRTTTVAGSIAEAGFRLMRRANDEFRELYCELVDWRPAVHFLRLFDNPMELMDLGRGSGP